MTIMRQRHKNPVDKKSQNKGRQVKKTDDPKIHPFSFRSTKKKKKRKKKRRVDTPPSDPKNTRQSGLSFSFLIRLLLHTNIRIPTTPLGTAHPSESFRTASVISAPEKFTFTYKVIVSPKRASH